MSSVLVLKRNPLFAQLSMEQLTRLAGLARPQRHEKDHVIFNEGDAGTAWYMIVKGRVKISKSSPDGKERTLVLLGPGDVFGELALIDGEPRSADAVVAEDSELLVVSREEFLTFVMDQPQVAMSLLVVLSQRLRHTNLLVHDAAFFDVRGRLARVLLELARGEGETEPGGALMCPQLTQSELASMVGVTRESINKWLRSYERSGTVTRRHGRLVVLDPQRLIADISYIV
jgi:CRP/FNR family transcriptional regulator, cyclic AMP receptor protein